MVEVKEAVLCIGSMPPPCLGDLMETFPPFSAILVMLIVLFIALFAGSGSAQSMMKLILS